MQTLQKSSLVQRSVAAGCPRALPALNRRNNVVVKATEVVEGAQLAVTAAPLYTVAAAEGIRAALAPTADYFATLGLPSALVRWGHPGNMAVVLLAMGGYGSYLGWQIRTSDDGDMIAKAKELHPKLSLGMFFFFALGATGGMMSLIMQGKPIFESSHVVTGLTGLALLSFQAMLPAFFSDSKDARTVHAYLGSAIMALFLLHGALGLQLGLSLSS
uniref:Cytochrome b561 domain-containing protein n=1 Tax=Tetradesmus obliquus TaxID=3088 RepID=A0A383W485_TETOB|eukprot:jgi/Sobl393_1/3339/SZX72455.1